MGKKLIERSPGPEYNPSALPEANRHNPKPSSRPMNSSILPWIRHRSPTKLLAPVVLAGVLGAGGSFLTHYWPLQAYFQPPVEPGRTLEAEEAADRAGRRAVAALGRLEPEGEVIDVGAAAGDRLGSLRVVEGQTVQAGEVLGYLETHAERRAEKEWIATQVREAQIRLEAETAHGEALIREAELAVQQVEQVQLLDIRAQEAKVRVLEEDLSIAQKELNRIRSLHSTGAVSLQESDQRLVAVNRAKEELLSARAVCDRIKVAREINLLQARAQLVTARAQLARVTSAIPIDSLTKNRVLAENRENLTVLRTPRAGRILRILTRPGEATGTKPILRLGQTGQMMVVAEVYETDVRHVRVGQKAEVQSPALAGTLTGTVARVGWLIYKNDVLHIDPTANTDARVVEVRIRLDQSEPAERLTNMQVNVRIRLHSEASWSAAGVP
jgi:HlyD family secretion protein